MIFLSGPVSKIEFSYQKKGEVAVKPDMNKIRMLGSVCLYLLDLKKLKMTNILLMGMGVWILKYVGKSYSPELLRPLVHLGVPMSE